MRSGRVTAAARGPRTAGGRPGEGAPGPLGLLALVAASAALSAALWALAGAPALPDGARLRGALQGFELSDADLVAAAAALCWLLLGYLALSVALRLAALVAARLSRGAAWARTGLRLSTLVTIPAVRRVVDSGVGGALLAASWLPLPPGAGYAQAPVHVAAAAAPAYAAVEVETAPAALPDREAAPSLRYTVAEGDDLWGIARRCYGDGTRFVELFEANRGRLMASGERFTDPRAIRAGWVLSVPLPASGVRAAEEALHYRVRAGDHLWGIAERWLGDGFLWVEIWERNRGREMGEGRRFTDPNVLVPGWVLELPLAGPSGAPHPVSAAAPGEPGRAPAAVAPEQGAASPAEDGAGAGGGEAEWPRPPRTALLSAAGVAVLGGAALVVKRLGSAVPLPLRGRGEDPADGDLGRAALVAGALDQALAEAGFSGSHPLLLRERGREIEVTVECPAGDAGALAERRHELARRLGCDLDASAEGPARVLVRLSRLGRFPGLPDAGPGALPALVVPAGATAEDLVYLNLGAAGSVTVTGSPREQRTLLRSWLQTLATLRPPDALSLRADAGAQELLREEAGLPHFAGGGGGVEPADLADELEEIVSSRRIHPGHPLVAIFAPAPADAELPAAAMRYGPGVGVVVIRCLPPGPPGEGAASSGATISFGEAGGEDGAEGEAPPPGGIALRLGRDRPLLLDPVRVRRDASPRWRGSAEQAQPPEPPDRPSPAGPGEDHGGEGHGLEAVPPPGMPGRGVGEAGPHGPAQWAPDDPPGAAEPATGGASRPPAPGAPSPGPAGTDGRASGASAGPAPGPEHADGPDLPPPPRGTGGREREGEGGVEEAASPVLETAGPAAPGGAGPARDAGVGDGADGAPVAHESAPAALPAAAGRPGMGRQGALLAHDDLGAGEGAAGSGAGAPFTVTCLGPFELRLGATPVTSWRREKCRELLALLAMHGGAPVPRESIGAALWPDYAWDAGTRRLLGNAVSALRSVVRTAAGDGALQPVLAAPHRYQLQPALFRIDIEAFDTALRRAGALTDGEALDEYERAVEIYAGALLEGESFPWLESYRQDCRQRMLDGGHRALALAGRLGEGQRAARLSRMILERVPTDEVAARARMRQLAAAGDTNGARRVFAALVRELQRELDDPRAAPAPETRALLDSLIAGAGGVPA